MGNVKLPYSYTKMVGVNIVHNTTAERNGASIHNDAYKLFFQNYFIHMYNTNQGM